MSKSGFTIKVENARQLRREIRNLQDVGLKKELRNTNKDAAEIVSKEAKRRVPVRSGALQASIRALGSQTRGQVAAGKGKTRVYAPIIHFGNPNQPIKPNPYLYDAKDAKVNEVFKAYVDAMNKLTKKVSSRGF